VGYAPAQAWGSCNSLCLPSCTRDHGARSRERVAYILKNYFKEDDARSDGGIVLFAGDHSNLLCKFSLRQVNKCEFSCEWIEAGENMSIIELKDQGGVEYAI
jgi:hypothetical protein